MSFIPDKVPNYHNFFGVFQIQILRINCPPQPLNLSPLPPQAQLPRWSWEGRKSQVASLYACSLALCCAWGQGQQQQQQQQRYQQPLRRHHDLGGCLEAASATSCCEGCAGPQGRRILNRWGECAWREVPNLISFVLRFILREWMKRWVPRPNGKKTVSTILGKLLRSCILYFEGWPFFRKNTCISHDLSCFPVLVAFLSQSAFYWALQYATA